MSEQVVQITNPNGDSSALLVCEHASRHIPDDLNGLGLTAQDAVSHAAWDPGALAVATHLSQMLNAQLVASGISRLAYDCNRPPSAPDAVPSRSERIEVPGNVTLSAANKADRVARFYEPFRAALAQTVAAHPAPMIVTIHSFTPVYHGQQRDVEIGILHDADTRLADAMMANHADHTALNIQRNAPYGPDDGVTHTLIEHAVKWGHPNVMIEIRNDLIATPEAQAEIADMLGRWLNASIAETTE